MKLKAAKKTLCWRRSGTAGVAAPDSCLAPGVTSLLAGKNNDKERLFSQYSFYVEWIIDTVLTPHMLPPYRRCLLGLSRLRGIPLGKKGRRDFAFGAASLSARAAVASRAERGMALLGEMYDDESLSLPTSRSTTYVCTPYVGPNRK